MGKRLMMMAAAGAVLCTFAATPTVSNVKAQQRYPWNALVDIDYELSGDTAGLGVSISVRDVQNNRDYQPTNFMEVLPTSVGKHRVTWNPAADGVSIISTNILVTVSLLRVADEPVSPNLYLVIDLSEGPDADNYPMTTLSAAPNGGVWPDEYKTTKLVLRKIEGGTFMMGGSKSTTITRPFYIGVFEVTQKQYKLVMGASSNPSNDKGDMKPVEKVSYAILRGMSAGADWPSSSQVDGTTFLGKLRAKSGLHTLDLPTEAQWEYACRAGSPTTFSPNIDTSGNDAAIIANFAAIGWCEGGNSSSAVVQQNISYPVGQKLPNAWGLYDMHGNVKEWCLDWWQSNYDTASVVDPRNDTAGTKKALRGGSAGWCQLYYCASGARDNDTPSSTSTGVIGCRLVCAATAH